MAGSTTLSISPWRLWTYHCLTISSMDARFPSLQYLESWSKWHVSSYLLLFLFLAHPCQVSALKHIHELGVVHRDVKPENILCVPDNPARVKLIDFGLAKFYAAPARAPVQKERMVGTTTWASLNSHNGAGMLHYVSLITASC